MTLIAWLNGAPIAELNDAGQGYVSLRYTEEAIRQHGPGTILLSLKLPVRAAPYAGTEAQYFLDGLLPEDHVRAALADRARVSTEDTYGLLKAYGLDCAGAIQVTAPDQGPGARQGGVHWLDGSELKKAISDLPAAPLGTDVDPGVRSSLGGLQGKLAVVLESERVGLPVDGTPSTHILKPARLTDEGIERWPGIAAAEHFAMRLTFLAGQSKGIKVRVAETEVRDIMGRTAILVKRFDRRGHGKGPEPDTPGGFRAGTGHHREIPKLLLRDASPRGHCPAARPVLDRYRHAAPPRTPDPGNGPGGLRRKGQESFGSVE